MEFDLQWLLLGLPIAFALGWVASRLESRQWQRDQRDAPRAYFKGLNLLLNEQQDKAIDAFIEAVQHDPDTTELHFALGNLFRRRGEFERAVRVHQHLLQRADLGAGDRDRAQHALAQDYAKAGLFDRAEPAYRALDGTPFETEARLALLGLYERARDWPAAIEVAQRLERAGAGSFAGRIAHYGCELALEADARGDGAAAEQALARALEAAPHAPRPLLIRAQRLTRGGDHDAALRAFAELSQRAPAAFDLAIPDFVASARAAGQSEHARQLLSTLAERQPSLALLRALDELEGVSPGTSPRWGERLRQQPTLSAALEVLDAPAAARTEAALAGVREAVARAARPLQRYRCAACGFEASQYFWQCPGCLSWDSYPPLRIEEL
ncbi:lipopolysaccharide assembly protein LapB [Azohydromonas sp.]|uniref:lipopolysaccharide assembly protein LapB n=1 Tax=Azohydromonas sp. TaxID=1872666 RepID=UPI002C3BD25D|nr:lipopolysaccharide assembly protein LapB [Azohydromonas sp.]HMM87450.1 lipopolysaccharide assembly protein LapB [Azohydromonas sp.]